VRAGERDQLIVGVEHLSRLVGPDGDGRERRDEQPGVEHGFDDRQHARVDRDVLVELAVHEQVVDADGPQSLEQIVGRDDAEVALEPQQVLRDGVDQVLLDDAFEHGVARLCDLSGVIGDRGGRKGHGPES